MTDPIADFLTRIRNAVKANHKVVVAPGSKIKEAITRILFEQGYILAYKFDKDEKGHPIIKIALKWNDKTNAIKDLKRVSRPGLRQYSSVANMPRVINGLGTAIVSTSKGIMTGAQAVRENVGGEVLCYIY
ncbi:MAG: 30S ribosomal protein S8 [Alistipes sp.]|jgi:small subunit ribosomal protein S8|nr:30S ribosomal protein S8 [Alistipes sp.]MBR1962739.1 30S ribosomal protein S8 [Alistipes sp.]